jgi:polysaccharide biosynthesis/export protein
MGSGSRSGARPWRGACIDPVSCIELGGKHVLTIIRSVAIAAMLALSACATSSQTAALPSGFAQPDLQDPTAIAGDLEYRIGPSDLLKVKVFQVEDLDREVRVNNAGEISLPLVGVVKAAGRTVNELEADLAQRFASRYLQNPQVTVFVEDFASMRVTVGGAVKKGGVFPVTSRLTLLQSIALAEGVIETANLKNVVVFREVGGERQFARFDLKQIVSGEMPDPELRGNDVVVVDTSAGKVALKNLIQLAPLLAVWGRYR